MKHPRTTTTGAISGAAFVILDMISKGTTDVKTIAMAFAFAYLGFISADG